MDMTLDAVAFFAEHAARALVHGRHSDAWSTAGAVFNDACPYGMPMVEYARKSIAQAHRAGANDARRILETLAPYRIVDAVIDGALGDVTDAERVVLVRARAVERRRAPARAQPLSRRPGAGSVVLAQRVALSTFTNHLARQILDDDAPRVSRALEALGLPAVSVAARAGRRQFIDHDRVERALARLGRRREGPEGRALESLGAFDTFAQAEDHEVFVPAGFTADALCVTPRSASAAAAAFSSCKRAAAEADLVLTNHALVLTDCRFRGGVLGIGATIRTVIFDEADALPEVARSVADERIGLDLVADTAAASGAGASEACRELVQLCALETARGVPRLLARCAASDAIVERVRRIRVAIETAAAADDDAAEDAALLAARLGLFLDSAHGDTSAVAAIAPGETPALAVVHRAPVRLLRHVFDTTQAAFLVSATLAVPAARPSPNALLRALGIGPGAREPGRINAAGWADLQPARYGEMDFRFADRSVPAPIRHVDGAPVSDPGHLDYVAQAIDAARRSGRVLVLCTSYRLAGELAARGRDAIVHAHGTRLASRLDAFRTDPNAVLLTPAAWTGLSLTGLVDHVVIPRIPFRPPSVEDEARRRFLAELGFAPSSIESLIARDRAGAARRTLAQGIGRGIRGPREHCTVWLLDPRFPLPKSMTRVIGGPDQGLAAGHLAFIHCIPARFRSGPSPAIDRGRIWPLAPDDSGSPPTTDETPAPTGRPRRNRARRRRPDRTPAARARTGS